MTETHALVPGLEPTAGQVQVMVFKPRLVKKIVNEAVPVVVVTVVVPDIALPPFSVRLATQLPIKAFPSSPFIVAMTIKLKFAEGLALLVTSVMEKA